MIFFAQPLGWPGGPIQIGLTNDLRQRLSLVVMNYFGQPMKLLKMLPGDRAEERAIYARFAAHRIGQSDRFYPTNQIWEFLGVSPPTA